MDKPIFSANNGRVYAIADEANDGIKAVPAELVVKAADDSTFTQISESNPLPVKMDGVELSIDPSSPLPVTGDVQLTGSNLRIEGSNNTLASGAITLANPLEVNATTDHRGILIATSGDTGVEMGFEHYVNGIGWLPWKDGLGAPVVVYLDENAVRAIPRISLV